jgi:hypothetical protein
VRHVLVSRLPTFAINVEVIGELLDAAVCEAQVRDVPVEQWHKVN